jgi:hypothetical protein
VLLLTQLPAVLQAAFCSEGLACRGCSKERKEGRADVAGSILLLQQLVMSPLLSLSLSCTSQHMRIYFSIVDVRESRQTHMSIKDQSCRRYIARTLTPQHFRFSDSAKSNATTVWQT